MNVILVSGRYPSSSAARRRDEDARFATKLAGAACRVRWVVPVSGTPPIEPSGVTMVPVRSPAPGFKAVEARLRDRFTEAALAREIRRDLPAVVHLLDYGGATSVNITWVAVRLGVPSVVSAPAAPTLCHRGDLVESTGSACPDWSDARRCAACCLAPSANGLPPVSSWFGRALVAVRWPFHSYPTATALENRRELVAGGLSVCNAIVATSDSDRDRILSLGLTADRFLVLASPAVEDWLAVYGRVART